MRVRRNSSELTMKSIMFAVVVGQGILSGFFEHVFNITTNSNLYVLICWAIIFLSSIITAERYKVKWRVIILMLIVCMIYITSKYVLDGCSYTPMMIIFYVLIPIFVASQDVSTEKVLRYIMYVSLLCLTFLDSLFAFQYAGYGQASMGNSYSVFSVVIAAIFHFKYYRKESSKFTKFLYVYNLFLIFRLIITANRGAVLSLFMCIAVLFLHEFDDNNQRIKNNSRKQYICIIALISIGIFFFLFSDRILSIAHDTLYKVFGSVPSFLTKSTSLLGTSEKGLDNGRSDLYMVVGELIKRNPIFGYGIGRFAVYTPYPWVHNYLLQFWFEGGILFFYFALFITFKYIVCMLTTKVKDKSHFVLIALLFSEAIPRYLISNDPWRGVYIWMLLSYGLSLRIKITRKYTCR